MEQSKALEELKLECLNCTGCSLCKTRKNVVFGTGDPNADLMFVGEAPGEKEDNSGIPFVGAAGQLLNRYLFAVDIDREKVYIANILKCRPPKNRDPLPVEEDSCMQFLLRQIEIIRPKLIVCLGRIAAKRLISENYMITKQHGTWSEFGRTPITAVYHPAALLRDPSKKGDMLEDMRIIKKKLDELSIKN